MMEIRMIIDAAGRERRERGTAEDMLRFWQWHLRSGDFCPSDVWSPPVNVYQTAENLEVCFDLAGMNRQAIEVRVEPGTLTVRGVRASPEPPRAAARRGKPVRILALEIDHGPFCRTISVPDAVDLAAVTSEYIEGMLWVRLPLRTVATPRSKPPGSKPPGSEHAGR